MFLASSHENTSKKFLYTSGTTLVKSSASSVGRGSECRADLRALMACKATISRKSLVSWILMVYTSSPASISHLKAATPIRLIEGGVILPKNLGSGSPRKGKESSSESELPRSPGGSSMGGGTEELVGPGPSKISGSLMCWTVVWPIGWGLEDSTDMSLSSTSSMKADRGRFDPVV